MIPVFILLRAPSLDQITLGEFVIKLIMNILIQYFLCLIILIATVNKYFHMKIILKYYFDIYINERLFHTHQCATLCPVTIIDQNFLR